MNNLPKIIIIFLFLALTAAPLAVFAAGSLVPCGLSTDYPDCVNSQCPDGSPCTVGGTCAGRGGVDESAPCSLCHLYVLIQRILGFIMWTIAPMVAVLAVAWGGFKILIAGEKPGLRAEGFKIIQTTVIGLAIMFSGWVLMNEALFFFTGANAEKKLEFLQSPWNKVNCSVPKSE